MRCCAVARGHHLTAAIEGIDTGHPVLGAKGQLGLLGTIGRQEGDGIFGDLNIALALQILMQALAIAAVQIGKDRHLERRAKIVDHRIGLGQGDTQNGALSWFGCRGGLSALVRRGLWALAFNLGLGLTNSGQLAKALIG